MPKMAIYYFSGTGNSLSLAKMLADRLGGEAIPIASVIDRETIEPNADVIGIVFPVYYTDLPNIVRRFAEKLDGVEGRILFGVANYGGAAGVSLKTLDRILRSRGNAPSAGFGVHMPQNAFRKPWESKKRIFRQAEKRIEFIARSVEAGKPGVFHSNLPLQMMLTPFQERLARMTVRHLEKISNTPSPSGLTVEQLIPLSDRSFAVNERCNGCGTCTRVCPVNNIEMVDAKPVWQSRCENCLACYQWCPEEAIHGGIANSGYRYRHPDIDLREIVASQNRHAA
ncbi:EFR1 family ferrodoxin [Candidatus Bipolaricaulota bacterium]|nr:EFR1 family ferrodoxin [Candidatus Bipolaricaulota bacterium]